MEFRLYQEFGESNDAELKWFGCDGEKITKKLSKMRALISDLKKAEKILSEYSGGYSGEHLSAEEFHKDLVNRISKLENGDQSVIEDLWVWFAPTCQWDDFVGNIDLGERIFQRLNKLKIKPAGNIGYT